MSHTWQPMSEEHWCPCFYSSSPILHQWLTLTVSKWRCLRNVISSLWAIEEGLITSVGMILSKKKNHPAQVKGCMWSGGGRRSREAASDVHPLGSTYEKVLFITEIRKILWRILCKKLPWSHSHFRESLWKQVSGWIGWAGVWEWIGYRNIHQDIITVI